MKKKSRSNNIHTATSEIPKAIKHMQKAIRLANNVSTPMAVKMVTKLFCKPTRKKLGKRQEKFYRSGTTDTLQIRGYKVKVFKKGTGRPVYVAHGWNSYGFSMRHIAEALVQNGYQVIMPDMPCHGRSSGTFVDQIEMAKVIEEILIHYNRQTPIEQIVTYSWGGTAVLLALDRIKNRNLLGFDIQRMVSVSLPSLPRAIMDIFCATLDLPEAVGKGLRRNIELIAENDGRTLEEAFPIGLTDLLENKSFDYLLLHGKSDEAISYENTLHLANQFPDLHVQLLEGLGHIDILKNEDVLNRVIGHLNYSSADSIAYMGMAAAR